MDHLSSKHVRGHAIVDGRLVLQVLNCGRNLFQFEKTYPEIYYSRYPEDRLSVMSQQSVPDKLRRAMKPLTRRHMKDFR